MFLAGVSQSALWVNSYASFLFFSFVLRCALSGLSLSSVLFLDNPPIN